MNKKFEEEITKELEKRFKEAQKQFKQRNLQQEFHKNLAIFEEFKRTHPDWEEHKEAMLRFIQQYPEFDKPERIADVYKFAKYYTPVDKTSLDYILGVEKKK